MALQEAAIAAPAARSQRNWAEEKRLQRRWVARWTELARKKQRWRSGGLYTGAAEPFPPRRREKTAISSWVVIGSVWVWIRFFFSLRRRFVLLIFCKWW
jgi:hypothetical protein